MRQKKTDNLGIQAQTDPVKCTLLYYRPKQQQSREVVTRFLEPGSSKFSSFEDRVESFEFPVTLNFHLTGIVVC